MILTILSHMAIVRILFVIGITAIVLPIFLFKLIKKGKPMVKAAKISIFVGAVMCIPMCLYFYYDIRYHVSEFTLNDRLYLAAENKNHTAAKALIDDGADPVGKNRYSKPAVYRSAELDDCEMLEIFLESGTDPNFTGDQKMTLIGIAAENCSVEMTEMLINAGAQPDYLCDRYVPALHYAAANDKEYNSELVEMLINAGADPASKAIVNGKVMLPYRYYYDHHKTDEDITAAEQERFEKIHEMLYPTYIEWLKDKLESENEERKDAEYEAVS